MTTSATGGFNGPVIDGLVTVQVPIHLHWVAIGPFALKELGYQRPTVCLAFCCKGARWSFADA